LRTPANGAELIIKVQTFVGALTSKPLLNQKHQNTTNAPLHPKKSICILPADPAATGLHMKNP
jgi:hypothetical protein